MTENWWVRFSPKTIFTHIFLLLIRGLGSEIEGFWDLGFSLFELGRTIIILSFDGQTVGSQQPCWSSRWTIATLIDWRKIIIDSSECCLLQLPSSCCRLSGGNPRFAAQCIQLWALQYNNMANSHDGHANSYGKKLLYTGHRWIHYVYEVTIAQSWIHWAVGVAVDISPLSHSVPEI